MLNSSRRRSAARADEVWSLLRSSVSRPPLIHPSVSMAIGRRYRLLDILIARVLSLLLPEFGWLMTTSTKYRRVELFGECTLFDIPELEVRGRDLVIGLCAQGQKKVDLPHLSADAIRVLGEEEPAHL